MKIPIARWKVVAASSCALLLELSSAGCALRFSGPAAAAIPQLGPPPDPPAPHAVAVPAEPAARDEVVTAETRDLAGVAVGIAPLSLRAEGVTEDPLHGLLRRLLAKSLRVLDLGGIGEIGATFERGASSERLAYSGRLDRMLWVADFVRARYVVVTEPLEVRTVKRLTPRRLHFPDGAIAAYAVALTDWNDRCRKAAPEVEQVYEKGSAEWREAEAKYTREKPWWSFLATEGEFDEARSANKEWLQRIADARARCQRSAIDPDALKKQDGAEAEPEPQGTAIVGSVRFRLLEVPGGRVLMTGRLARDGERAAEVVERLLDGMAAALTASPATKGKRR